MLKPKDTKQKRDKYLNSAILTREQGNLIQSETMFKEVIEWDDKHKNQKGKSEALGHLRIAYTRMGDASTDKKVTKNYYQLAMETSEQALQIQQSSINKIHSAATRLDYSQYLTSNAKKAVLKSALNDIKGAIKNLDGSVAHKAWPANTKAKIQYSLGDVSGAINTLTDAEAWIFEGYGDEVKSDKSQAELKLNVWLCGLHLTLAKICASENKDILAKHYANSVLNLDDPKSLLGERKKEAQRILDSIS